MIIIFWNFSVCRKYCWQKLIKIKNTKKNLIIPHLKWDIDFFEDIDVKLNFIEGAFEKILNE